MIRPVERATVEVYEQRAREWLQDCLPSLGDALDEAGADEVATVLSKLAENLFGEFKDSPHTRLLSLQRQVHHRLCDPRDLQIGQTADDLIVFEQHRP